MATFAVINEGVVENCIVADSLAIAEEVSGKTCAEYTSENPAGIGFTYADGVFTDPNAPIPSEEVPAEETPAEEE
jgi:hypothetical protein